MKDNINSPRDLANLRIRKEVHLKTEGDGVLVTHAYFIQHRDEKKDFCTWLSNVKLLNSFASNITTCVNIANCKIFDIKSYDCYIFIKRLLPIAVG